MTYNYKFAKVVIENEIASIEYAPAEFDLEGVHYNSTNWDEHYNAIGYYALVRTESPIKEGYYYTPKYTRSQRQGERYDREGVWSSFTQEILLEEWEEHENPVPEPTEEAEYAEAAKILLGESE